MTSDNAIRYVLSLSLEEAASGCDKTIDVKSGHPCPSCGGSGKSLTPDTAACRHCLGAGQVFQSQRLPVRIPAGVSNGFQLPVAWPQNGGGRAAGKLEVMISITAHQQFQRIGDDVECELPVGLTQAALGATVTVPTLSGSARLKIPPGTQNGDLLRLKGKGIPHLGGRGRGDQIIRVRLVTPTSLDEQQRSLLARLDKSLP